MNKNVKRILMVVAIIASMCVGSFATQYYLNATQVTYNDGGEGTTVAAALNDLYGKAQEAKEWKDGFENTTATAANMLSGTRAYAISGAGSDNVTRNLLIGTMANRGSGIRSLDTTNIDVVGNNDVTMTIQPDQYYRIQERLL